MILDIFCFDIQFLVNCKKNFVKSYSPTLNAFFSKQCFSHIRKVFVASTCNFLLIFCDCATLIGRSVLSRRFFKVYIFRSRNYDNRTFWHILGSPLIFSISSTQKSPYIDFILQAKFEKVWIVRSWEILSERISLLWFSG